MIIRKKKKPLLIIILAASLALVTAAAIIIGSILLKPDPVQTEKPAPPEIIEEEGEALFNGSAVAFAQVPEAQLDAILVVGREHAFGLEKTDGENGLPGIFELHYRDADGKFKKYYPAINEYDPTFNYEDIYATVKFGDYGDIPILTYLCVAVGTTYFEERIPVSEYIDERNEQLKHYGLSLTDDYVTVTFTYTYNVKDENGEDKLDEDGKPVTAEGNHKIMIGEPLATGGGYYFMVDDRNYVYSTTNNYFDYAMLGFTDLIRPLLTAEGLPEDSAFEPYLTTDYKHYKNEINKTEGATVPEGATVIVDADAFISVTLDTVINPYDTSIGEDGYIRDGFGSVSFDLEAYAKDKNYSHLAKVLAGQKIGKLDSHLFVTLPTYSKTLELDKGNITMRYKVVTVESVIRDGVEIVTEGTEVEEGDLLRVTYYLMDSEGHLIQRTLHAVMDTASPYLPEQARETLLSAKVGNLEKQLDFDVVYSEENSVVRNYTLTVSEIIKITDEDNRPALTAVNGTTVIYRYYISVDGERVYEGIDKVTLADTLTGDAKTIADVIRGKTCMSGLNAEAVKYTEYSELMADFITYEIREIKYFVTKRMVAGFEFIQASKRDPYYGESLYQNTTDNEDRLYALNASACEAIVKILGGIGESTTASSGLIGLETVAIGLTPDILDKYGLYAYTVYFELPRGITNVVYNDSDQTLNEYLNTLDDYTYYTTLGFTLYISDEVRDEDGRRIRYIASDMYDLVAKVPVEDFVFLNYEFEDFYARTNLVLTDISNIKTVTVEFMMKDLYGKFVNELTHTKLFAYNGQIYTESSLPEGAWESASEFDGINVYVTPVGVCTPNGLIKFMDENGYKNGVSLYELYGKEYLGTDTLGTAYFKEFTETLFYTYFAGTIEKEDQEKYLDEISPIMRMSVTMGEPAANGGSTYVPTSSYDYVYEFYRYTDGCVMVRVYRQNRSTGTVTEEVSDFYISLFSFKKLVCAYWGLMNAQEVDNDLPFATPNGADLIPGLK